MAELIPNSYSTRWFDFFHVPISEARTAGEIAFISKTATLPDFFRILDVCCGMGRHARALCSQGYSVTGLERDARALAEARNLAGGPVYLETDIRHYQPGPDSFDAAIIMSQSFGYFDSATNIDMLSRLRAGIRDGGLIILDLWNPEFFNSHAGENEFQSPKGTVRERRRMIKDRLLVHLDYPDGGCDDFDWQLFTPAEMTIAARAASLELLFSCTNYDIGSAPSPAQSKIQYVLRK